MTTAADGVAWVTGASSGIGRALASRLASEGWTVAASARRTGELEELARTATKGAGRIVPVPCDVTDARAVADAVADIEARHGPIALAVLNAGSYLPDSAESFDLDAFRKTVELNLLGTVNCLDALLPRWRARRRGHLAVVSSVAGYRGLPASLSYGATKAALINLCEGLWFDFRRLGLKVQVINPGFVRTPLTDKNTFPMPFLIDADDAARRIAAGLKSTRFEIAFPRRFVCLLKVLRILPYGLYFPLVGRRTGR